MPHILLHFGGASTATATVTVIVIFLLIFALSFAFGSVPEGGKKLSAPWLGAWFRASLPRLIIAALFSGGIFLGSSLSGGTANTVVADPSVCGKALPRLSDDPVTPRRLDAAVQGLAAMATAAGQGNADAVRTAFFGDTHNLTHDIDPVIRPDAPALAKQSCETVIAIETQIAARNPDLPTIQKEAGELSALLLRGRLIVSLAASPDAQPGGGATNVCDQPLPPLTNQPITQARLSAAIQGMRDICAAAAAGDKDAATRLLGSDAHTVTHDIDPPLRAADASLAKQLCESVVQVEVQIAGKFDAMVIQQQAEASAGYLQQAGQALGVSP